MPSRARTRLALAAIAAGVAVAAAAQVVEGVDVGAARARAKAYAADQQRFAAEVARRGDALRADAERTARGAQANRSRVATPAVSSGPTATGVDFDQLVASANASQAGAKMQGPKFIAFASTSMPVASMKAMLRDVTRAGGVVVFRGFRNNSVKQHMAYLQQVVAKGEKVDGLGIDPRLFRAFNVAAVPAYVVVSSDFEPCDGLRCTTRTPPYDIVTGNITAAYALQTFVNGRGPGAAIAKVHLTRLSRSAGR